MWRLFSLASLIVAAGVIMWLSRGLRHAGENTSPAQGCECRVVEVIHYGGNLVCHERLLTKDVVGCGNNMIGRARVEAMNTQKSKPRKQEEFH